MKHFLSVDDLTKNEIDEIFKTATACQSKPNEAKFKYFGNWDSGYANVPFNYQIATIFLEPSTRTRLSFESAANRLGGSVLSVPNKEISSWTKGERMEDMIKTISQYVDLIVLRSSQPGAARLAAEVSDVPVINAGDGDNEHPTQALLDLYTIEMEKGTVDGLNILFYGDIRHARTIKSLSRLLDRHYNVEVQKHCITGDPMNTTGNIKEKIYKADVIYMTRIQKERYGEGTDTPIYRFAQEDIKLLKEDAIIMHPLPRRDEISLAVDDTSHAAYWKQVKNGLYVRMALLKIMLGH